MTTRSAKAHWEGTLFEGKGSVALESSGAGAFDVSWPARTEAPGGQTSPEELIAAAHASCFSMALSNQLAQAGGTVEALDTTADVTIEKTEGGFTITGIKLTVRGRVPGLDAAAFASAAEQAKTGCPVSKALTGTAITLDASLEG
ncbi:MAG: OsmC family peroxiredoxin [Frankiaceae bacterium]